jgi:hypothetical protein
VAEEEVLGDAHLGDEVQLLIDHGDAGGEGVGGVVKRAGLSVEGEGAAGRRVGAAEDFKERGFARAIFAHERVDRAGADFKRDVVERLDARELHRDVVEGEGGGGVHEMGVSAGSPPAEKRNAGGPPALPA